MVPPLPAPCWEAACGREGRGGEGRQRRTEESSGEVRGGRGGPQQHLRGRPGPTVSAVPPGGGGGSRWLATVQKASAGAIRVREAGGRGCAPACPGPSGAGGHRGRTQAPGVAGEGGIKPPSSRWAHFGGEVSLWRRRAKAPAEEIDRRCDNLPHAAGGAAALSGLGEAPARGL